MTFAGIIREGVQAPHPDRCICCGQQRRPMATTGVEIPGWGTVNICVGTQRKPGCLLQAAKEAGCLLPGDALALENANAELDMQVTALTLALQRKPKDTAVEVVEVDRVAELVAERFGA